MNRERELTERREARRARIGAAVLGAFAVLAPADVATILQAIKLDRGVALRDLDEHLVGHPDALVSGDPRCPAALVRLTRALRDAGVEGVVVPGCRGCGRSDVELPFNRPEGRTCRKCYITANKKPCARCGRIGRISARRPEGGICGTCYRQDPERLEECARCGRVGVPNVRLPDGTARCESCRETPQRVCAGCGVLGPAVLGPDGPCCDRCYRRFRAPRRRCGRCGNVTIVARRASGDAPDLCYNCSTLLPPAACSVCGKVKPGYQHAVLGFVCRYCRDPKRPCSGCGRVRRPATTTWPMGPVCTGCYARIVDHPAFCPSCGTQQPLIARSDDGPMICGRCAGLGDVYICSRCGHGGRLSRAGLCARCTLPERLAEHLAGPDGRIPDQLKPVFHALLADDSVERAQGVIYWLTHSPNARLLASLAASGQPLTHDLLDGLPPGLNEYYVRQALVHTGVLPERNEDLERIPAWLDELLAGHPSEHARLIRPYVHWFLLRRARRRAAQRRRRRATKTGAKVRGRVRVALNLLSWLDEHDLALERLSQTHVDEWLTAGSTVRYEVRYFLNWAADRGLTPRLVVPHRPRQDPARVLPEEDRWELLNRCINDTNMSLDVRAAGALVLLFGLPVTQLVQLRADDLHDRDGDTYLAFGACPMLIPPRLATLLRQLAATPSPRYRFSPANTPAAWLFPGHALGRPVTAETLGERLHDHGIDSRPARNAALMALITDTPAPILADLIDLHPTTAEKWAALATRDWTDYLAARASDIAHAPLADSGASGRGPSRRHPAG